MSAKYLEFALSAAAQVKDDRFRGDGLRAEVARMALQSGQLPMAAKALSQISPNDYRFPLLCAEWFLRGGRIGSSDAPHLTLEHAWNLAVTLAPRRRAEAVAAMKSGFPELADRPLPVAAPLASGNISAEVAGFRFACLRQIAEGKLPGKPEWQKAIAMTKSERFGVDPEGLLLTDCLIELGLEIVRREPGADLRKLNEAIDATLAGSKVPSLPQGIGFAHLLLATGEREKAADLMGGLSGTVARISARSPLRSDLESRIVLLEIMAGLPEQASRRASGLLSHLEAQMDYEQFIHSGEVLAALLATGKTDEAIRCLQRLADSAEKNDNPNNLHFLRGNVALSIARAGRVTKVSQSIPPVLDTVFGRP